MTVVEELERLHPAIDEMVEATTQNLATVWSKCSGLQLQPVMAGVITDQEEVAHAVVYCLTASTIALFIVQPPLPPPIGGAPGAEEVIPSGSDEAPGDEEEAPGGSPTSSGQQGRWSLFSSFVWMLMMGHHRAPCTVDS